MPKTKVKKPPVSPLVEDLKRLAISAKRAKNQITFHISSRTYGQMAEFFGLHISDPELSHRVIWKDDIDLFVSQLEKILRDKYATRHYLLPDNGIQPYHIKPHQVSDNSPQVDELSGEIEEPSIGSTYIDRYPDQKAILKTTDCNQRLAAKTLWDGFTLRNEFAQMLIAPTQTGKTFVVGSFLKNWFEQGYGQGCIAPWPVFYITKATVLEQTKDVLRDWFDLPMHKIKVINIEAITRGCFGKHFVSEEVIVVDNVEQVKWLWTPFVSPHLVISDECHMFIRAGSLQTSMFMGLTEMLDTKFIFMSATPLSRVSEGKVFACATRKNFELGMATVPINDNTWPAFAKQIAYPAAPEEHTIAAKERYAEFFSRQIVKIKNIRPKFKAINQIMPIPFRTKWEYDFYNTALERYYKQKAEIEGRTDFSPGESQFALLAAFTILRHAAEECKVDQLVEFAVKTWNEGYAPFLGMCFKRPILKVIKKLIENYGWSREDVSVIWGGSQETLNKKKKLAKQIASNDELVAALGASGIDLRKLGIKLDELNEKTKEELEFERKYKLLGQSKIQREEERLRYKRQDSRILIYSYKSGGVGLSASHEPGYGDKVRPRQGCLTLVYNEKELVQGIGRPHAITSISETLIMFPYYQGTIEEDVAIKVKQKLRCLKAGTGSGEAWETIITGTTGNEQKIINNPAMFEEVDESENALIEV